MDLVLLFAAPLRTKVVAFAVPVGMAGVVVPFVLVALVVPAPAGLGSSLFLVPALVFVVLAPAFVAPPVFPQHLGTVAALDFARSVTAAVGSVVPIEIVAVVVPVEVVAAVVVDAVAVEAVVFVFVARRVFVQRGIFSA